MTGTLTSGTLADLDAARARTTALTTAPDEELAAQHSPLMSPLVWDLAHIPMQEEVYLLQLLDRRPPLLDPGIQNLYDAFRHPRAGRVRLPLMGAARARDYAGRVRAEVTRVLERRDDPEAAFSAALVVQHEQQHVETMLATHQLRAGPPLLAPAPRTPSPPRPGGLDPVLVPGGPCALGVDADEEPTSLDNERGRHVVDVPGFRLGRTPVTQADWQHFVDDGGYRDPRLWSSAGWAHRMEAGLDRPLFWSADGSVRRFGIDESRRSDDPVQHVSYWEAEAFARYAGGRLPTEQEWEKAAAWDPAQGRRRRWPWGDSAPTAARATLDGDTLRPAPAGSLPGGASAYGIEQLIGDVWEWTSSPLSPWPGFTPMVYDSYSAPFFGPDHRVLRGGSWATGTPAVRPSFRNWDLPQRRQIFAGVRVAWDA